MIERLIAWCARNRFLVVFATLAALTGAWQSMVRIPLDAIPDLSDTQVIVYSRWDRSPDVLEDQVTYPIVTALLGAPRVKAVRGFTDFGYSYVYVIFDDGVDPYWARSRTLEYLSKILPRLPEGVKTELGPDATGVGWVYQYALIDKSGRWSLADLRAFQDWTLRYRLQSVPGVAEVAAVGGFQKQYQIQVNANLLASYGIPLATVVKAVREGNEEVGGRLVEMSGAEYMVRGRGYARSASDLGELVIGRDRRGTPVLVKNVASVTFGPDLRRGVADLDGEGDAVGAIVIMRYGENALNVIARVKERLASLKASLPEGVEVVTVYDRSDLISRALDTLKEELTSQLVLVSLVILLFLWHIPSAVVPIVTIPISVALTFIPLHLMGVTANVMSLTGIAISIGVLVDGAIVEVENAYNKIHLWEAGGRKGDIAQVRLKSLQEVGPSVFYSVLVIGVAFVPIFALVDQEGRLFKPLAASKNLAMFIAAGLAVTLDPAVRMMFTRVDPFAFKNKWLTKLANATLVGTYRAEKNHPISRVLFKFYEPACRWVLGNPWKTIMMAGALSLSTVPVFLTLGSEFMPSLDEGSILYMPTTMPGLSVTEAQRLLSAQNRVLKSFPEVERVFGKAGRAETATDPAPFSMFETVVTLKPKSAWRPGLTSAGLVAELDSALKIPGFSNAWTMPIKTRIDMLSTGVRTPVGIKIFGADLAQIEGVALRVEEAVRGVKGVRSAFAERAAGGYFLDFDLKREQLARHGLTVREAQQVITAAIGGETVTTVVEGRARYSVSVRYPRELRENTALLKRVLVATASGGQVPLGQLAEVSLRTGPSMIRDENGLLAAYVFVDVDSSRDLGGFVADAKRAVESTVRLPTGVSLQWSGQYENMARVKERLKLVVPLTLFVIVLLLHLNTGSWFKTGLILLAVPFSAIGAVWLLWALGYNLSIAVWVGVIALLGLDAETGVFMLLYLELAWERWKAAGRLNSTSDLREAIVEGAVKRVRPKLMMVAADVIGLLPVMTAVGAGSDVMKRIAAPLVGGLATSFILELLVYPAIYYLWKVRELKTQS